MTIGATELLSLERDAEISEGRSPATEMRWSRRRAAGFVTGASILLWTLIVLVGRGGF